MSGKRGMSSWVLGPALVIGVAVCLGMWTGAAAATTGGAARQREAQRTGIARVQGPLTRPKPSADAGEILLCSFWGNFFSGLPTPQQLSLAPGMTPPSQVATDAAAQVAGAMQDAVSASGQPGQPSLGQVGGVQSGSTGGSGSLFGSSFGGAGGSDDGGLSRGAGSSTGGGGYSPEGM